MFIFYADQLGIPLAVLFTIAMVAFYHSFLKWLPPTRLDNETVQ
ncbi:hypothetical protein [Bartonella sp. ML71XJBT]|nr:hypothetical protein [Bartonella sp. ML71XJBT]